MKPIFQKMKIRWREYQLDVGVMAIIALCFLLFFAWSFVRGQLLLGGDAFFYSYPLRSVAWSMVRQGTIPLWTPAVMSGYPLLSMAQLALAYPLTWGYLIFPGYIAEQLYVFAPFLLAPAFTYAFARTIQCSRPASLLAGLSFGYGGAMTNLLGIVGIVGNSFMWLPLLLIPIARAQSGRFIPNLILGAVVYAMSILNGHGQAFLYVGLVAIAYGAYLGCFPAGPTADGLPARLLKRWQPLGVALTAVLFATGLSAFQILETMRAARRSIRSSLNFISFTSGWFPPEIAFKSLVTPLYIERFADVTAFVSPLVFGLALVACVNSFRRSWNEKTAQVLFWTGTAVLSGLLILGPYTPLARLLFHVPITNQFRVPSRHAYEWTFALSILAAFGWDTCRRVLSSTPLHLLNRGRLALIACLIMLALSANVGWYWLRATLDEQISAGPNASDWWYTGLPVSSYIWFKITATALVVASFWLALRFNGSRWRRPLLAAIIVLGCLTEPYILVRNWWEGFAKTPDRILTPAPITGALRIGPSEIERVYTRFELFADDSAPLALVDAPNLTALYGLHNVAGYEPLLLERYSRALGNVGLDTVTALPGYPPADSLLHSNSHVLDLLNTGKVAAYRDLRPTRSPLQEYEGIKIDLSEAGLELLPAASEPIGQTDFTADTLLLVTSLAHAADIPQKTPVGRIRVWKADGRSIELELRAGLDTAEWAHERPDIRASAQHTLAPVFDRQAGDFANTYQALRYVARVKLGERATVRKVELQNLSSHARLALWAASLYDSKTEQSEPLVRRLFAVQRDPGRWQIERRPDDLLILHNQRALPRAWLVAEAEAVDGEDALRRIRGESDQPFDPRRTALLEVAHSELPSLPGGSLPPESQVRFTSYESNRLVLETESAIPTVLVLSEIFYPGWEAHIDGTPTRILLTNYLLRGIAVPSGNHRIEMFYRAHGARNGAIISVCTLLLLIILGVYSRRQHTRRRTCGPPPPERETDQKNE